jgi:hypothetical protein
MFENQSSHSEHLGRRARDGAESPTERAARSGIRPGARARREHERSAWRRGAEE